MWSYAWDGLLVSSIQFSHQGGGSASTASNVESPRDKSSELKERKFFVSWLMTVKTKDYLVAANINLNLSVQASFSSAQVFLQEGNTLGFAGWWKRDTSQKGKRCVVCGIDREGTWCSFPACRARPSSQGVHIRWFRIRQRPCTSSFLGEDWSTELHNVAKVPSPAFEALDEVHTFSVGLVTWVERYEAWASDVLVLSWLRRARCRWGGWQKQHAFHVLYW